MGDGRVRRQHRRGEGRDISIAAQAEHLLAWLEAIGIDGALFVGHDLGGGVLQIAAVRAPGRFAGLVLTNSIAYGSWPIPSVKAMRALCGAMERMPRALLRITLAALLFRGHDDHGRARESLDVHWQPYREHGAAALIRQVRALDVNDTLSCRIGFLVSRCRPGSWGEADQFQEVAYGERLARDLGASFRRIPGGKHFTPEDHPDEVATAANELLRETAGH